MKKQQAGGALLFLAMLAACQSPAPQPASLPLLEFNPGYVIGTADYGLSEDEPTHTLVRLVRQNPQGAAQSYLLDASYDPRSAQAVFAGLLPAGVYVIEEALTRDGRYVPGTLRMPFEVLPGQVTDAGHLPLLRQSGAMRAGFAP